MHPAIFLWFVFIAISTGLRVCYLGLVSAVTMATLCKVHLGYIFSWEVGHVNEHRLCSEKRLLSCNCNVVMKISKSWMKIWLWKDINNAVSLQMLSTLQCVLILLNQTTNLTVVSVWIQRLHVVLDILVRVAYYIRWWSLMHQSLTC